MCSSDLLINKANRRIKRVKKMGGGMSTARKDMMSGYYKNDMGMKGGAMYKEGGKVGKKKQGYRSEERRVGNECRFRREEYE